jgi:hypothetical protein
MKTITLVACNRLHYLRQTIECLKKNNLDGYKLFLGVEPLDEAVIAYCRGLNFMPFDLTINSERLGVAWNPKATISRAFDAGTDFNVALEDDLLLSPDALDLANWFFALRNSGFFSMNFCNYRSDAAFPIEVEETDHFIPLGWAVNRAVWRKEIEPNWMCDPRGWDFSVNKILEERKDRKVLQPRLARSKHNGREGGEHCTAEFHDRVFQNLPISDGSARSYTLDGGTA